MTDEARLPDGVAELLDRTLREGGSGVLADWLDDHSNYWDGFAAALRQSSPAGELSRFRGFRYQIVCPGVMFWVREDEIPAPPGRPRKEVLLLGVYRAAPFAPAMWRRVVSPDQLPKAVRRRLWAAFGISRLTDRE